MRKDRPHTDTWMLLLWLPTVLYLAIGVSLIFTQDCSRCLSLSAIYLLSALLFLIALWKLRHHALPFTNPAFSMGFIFLITGSVLSAPLWLFGCVIFLGALFFHPR